MIELRELHRRMDREALILGNRLSLVLDTLEQLRRLTLLLFRHTPNDPQAIAAWLEREGFATDDEGFFRPQSQVGRITGGAARPDEVTFGWAGMLKDDPILRFRLYALRDLGADLQALKRRVEGAAWMYYQDVRNAAVVFPATDIAKVVPSDFDWHTYHPYLTTGPDVNPQRRICWTAPNIDYGGEGLIITASIPVYVDDDFHGLWSIDIPVHALLCDNFKQAPVEGQVSFISDAEGNLLLHPSFETEIDRDKGTIYHKTLAHIGGDFQRIDTAKLLEQGSGELTAMDGSGAALYCIFQAISSIRWLLFSTFSVEATIVSSPTLPAQGNQAGSGERIFSGFPDSLEGLVLEGKYRMGKLLGSGGFGAVYHAVQLALNRPVAVKVLRPSFDRDPEARLRRFQREGISACRVQHPNAVAVLDFGISPHGLPYLVMELLEGHSLSEELRQKGPLPFKRALPIAATIARVLSAAHAAGIIHRDVKPDNVFLHMSGAGEFVKVLDFGLAKLAAGAPESAGALTTTGEMMGTPLYMAPELADGRPIEPRTDVYSLGILLYELLAGVPPFRGESDAPWKVILQHVTQAPPNLLAVLPAAPPPLAQLVYRMLCKTPAERPHAVEVAEELEKIAAAPEAA